MFTSLRCGETAALKGGEHISNTEPHLSRHPTGIPDEKIIWPKEYKK